MLLETLNEESFNDFILFTQGKNRLGANKADNKVSPKKINAEKEHAK